MEWGGGRGGCTWLTVPVAITLFLWIAVNIHEDTVVFPQTTVLNTLAVTSWTSVEAHDMLMTVIGWDSRYPVPILKDIHTIMSDSCLTITTLAIIIIV